MGRSPCVVQLWTGISEKTWKHYGGCAELSHHSTGPRNGEIYPWWSSNRSSASGWSAQPAVVKGDLNLEKEVHVTAGHALIQMHVMDWPEAQREDPMLSEVLDWLKAQKKTDLKALLAEQASSDGRPIRSYAIDKILWVHQSSLISALNAQGQDWGFTTICSP